MTVASKDDPHLTEYVLHYKKHFNQRLVWTYLVVLAGLLTGGWTLHTQTVNVNTDSYHRCLDRQSNVDTANVFYQAMSKLEAKNKFVDHKLRDQRVALYKAEILSKPNCGEKP